MTPLLPTFFSSPKKKSSTPQNISSKGWQKSGPELNREGVRKGGALTSIHNVSRGSSANTKKGNTPVSSIARARNAETSATDTHHHHRVSTEEEARDADEKRYDHIRRLIKKRKQKELGKGKSKGLFF